MWTQNVFLLLKFLSLLFLFLCFGLWTVSAQVKPGPLQTTGKSKNRNTKSKNLWGELTKAVELWQRILSLFRTLTERKLFEEVCFDGLQSKDFTFRNLILSSARISQAVLLFIFFFFLSFSALYLLQLHLRCQYASVKVLVGSTSNRTDNPTFASASHSDMSGVLRDSRFTLLSQDLHVITYVMKVDSSVLQFDGLLTSLLFELETSNSAINMPTGGKVTFRLSDCHGNMLTFSMLAYQQSTAENSLISCQELRTEQVDILIRPGHQNNPTTSCRK